MSGALLCLRPGAIRTRVAATGATAAKGFAARRATCADRGLDPHRTRSPRPLDDRATDSACQEQDRRAGLNWARSCGAIGMTRPSGQHAQGRRELSAACGFECRRERRTPRPRSRRPGRSACHRVAWRRDLTNLGGVAPSRAGAPAARATGRQRQDERLTHLACWARPAPSTPRPRRRATSVPKPDTRSGPRGSSFPWAAALPCGIAQTPSPTLPHPGGSARRAPRTPKNPDDSEESNTRQGPADAIGAGHGC